MKKNSEYSLLESFVVDNAELETLESQLERFNIFEALGAVRQELRHSSFLAFVLDPSQNHGLGDLVLKRFLKRVLLESSFQDAPISAVDIDVFGLHEVIVLREWRNIDILIVDEENKFVVTVENKIDSTESTGQLDRYQQTVKKHYPDFKQLYIFLTPDGDPPSNDSYLPVSYTLICDVLENIISSRENTTGPEVVTLLKNYTEMLRRHIVAESEIADLCQRIYQKHKKALDLIFEHKPDLQSDIGSQIEELIQAESCLQLDMSSKSYIRFMSRQWDIDVLNKGKGWVKSNRILLFEIENTSRVLILKLVIGPGDTAIREKLFKMASGSPQVFKKNKTLYPKWQTIYSRKFFTQKNIQEDDMDTLVANLNKQWQRFIKEDLPPIQAAVKKKLKIDN